jgi:hypothetical protein
VTDLHHRHPAFIASCVCGAVGVLMILAAALGDVDSLYFAGIVAGAASLGAALYWRSLLVSDWAERKRR